MDDWQCVGLEGPSRDAAEIKRAYAKRLRVTRPDDDPQGYQSLREAYDRLMADARRATDLPAPEKRVVMSEPIRPVPVDDAPGPGLAPREWLSPESLCARFIAAFQLEGASAAQAHLLELMHDLQALPLQAQDEASVRFADAVIAHRDLPAVVQVALRDHFGWLGDYRTERLLGLQRANALAYYLADLVAPETDPAVLERFTDVLEVNRLIKRGHLGLARLFTTLADEVVREQLANVHALTDAALRRQLDQAGRRLLAALPVEPHDQNQVASALALSRKVRMVLLACVIAFALRFDGSELVLAFLCSGLLMGAGCVGVGLTWLIVQVTHWLRRVTAGTSDRFLRRFLWGRPAAVQAWGLVLMAAGAAVIWTESASALAQGTQGLVPLGFVLAGLGTVLMVPDDIQGTLVGIGSLCYLAVVAHGLPWVDVILLTAWLFCGIPLLSNGRFRQLTEGAMTLPRAVAAAVVGIPVAMAWVASRWGYRLPLWCMLVAAAAQIRPFPIPAPTSSRLMLLPICLAAGFCARACATGAGRWLMARVR